MRIGLHAGHENSTLEDLIKLWKMADDGGFYWISVWDHLLPFPTISPHLDCHEAFTTLGALVHSTKHVRVGCLVFCIGMRHPSMLAKQAVTLDHLSNGRLEIGMGAGWNRHEHEPFGLPFPALGTRFDMLEEGLQIVKALINGERVTFHGEHYQLNDAWCQPRALQKSPRIWVGGAGEKRSIRIAARYADGWNVAYVSPASYRHKNSVLERWCDCEQRDSSEIVRSVNLGFYMGVDEARARRNRQRYDSYFGEQAERFREGSLFGTPATVVDRLGEYADAGVTDLNITMRAPYDFDAMACFVEEILPKVNA